MKAPSKGAKEKRTRGKAERRKERESWRNGKERRERGQEGGGEGRKKEGEREQLVCSCSHACNSREREREGGKKERKRGEEKGPNPPGRILDDTRIDPNHFGGVTVRINAAHGTAANLCIPQGDDMPPLVLAAQDADAGAELKWDYQALTDNPRDPLHAECTCGGRACVYKHLGIRGRKCTSTLMEYKKRVK